MKMPKMETARSKVPSNRTSRTILQVSLFNNIESYGSMEVVEIIGLATFVARLERRARYFLFCFLRLEGVNGPHNLLKNEGRITKRSLAMRSLSVF